ncbi:MAG: VIT and VWA domain-containing protein [Oscillospiraceae bacterium]|nr:VIT and VWA domain-containing protein [Oscillospiraceae bacterium]
MKKRSFSLLLVGVLLVFTFNLSAVLSFAAESGEQSDNLDENVTLSPYFFIENEDVPLDNFPLKETNVNVNINGVIASIFVTQTYENKGNIPINASYVFPASTRVSVHGMKIEVGEDIIIAQIKEREEARQDFERAREQGQTASLLEQERPNVFSMSVANIMPNDIVRIELHYTELITPTEGIYEFVFPTVVGPRYSPSWVTGEQWIASPYLVEGETPPDDSGEYNITVNLATGLPISSLECKSHTVDISYTDDSTAALALVDDESFAGNRDFIVQYKLAGDEIICGLMLQEGVFENHFLLMVQPPERPVTEYIAPREYIFIFDVSGSMHGFPLETSKELLKDFLVHLRDIDSFNLILFDSRVIQMSPESMPATQNNITNAIKLIDDEFGGGGTELLKAVETAIAVPMSSTTESRSIVLLTDGYFSGEEAVFNTISKNTINTNYFSFGIGHGTNRYIIEGIAKAGNGEAFILTKPTDIPETAARFRSYIESPVLSDITVTFNGFDAYDVEPTHFSILFAQRPLVVTGKWRGQREGTIRITGKSGNTDFVQEISVYDTELSESDSPISYLWARMRVDRLMDTVNNQYGGSYQSSQDAKKQIIEIGLEYSMLTAFTSFIAVFETKRTDTESVDINQPLPLPLGVSDYAVGTPAGSWDINERTGGSALSRIIISAFISASITSVFTMKKRKKE